jgi:hypothetical protein
MCVDGVDAVVPAENPVIGGRAAGDRMRAACDGHGSLSLNPPLSSVAVNCRCH